LGGCLGPAGSACITGIKTARWGGGPVGRWAAMRRTNFFLSIYSLYRFPCSGQAERVARGRSGAQETRPSGKKRACVSRGVIPSDIALVVVVPWEERR